MRIKAPKANIQALKKPEASKSKRSLCVTPSIETADDLIDESLKSGPEELFSRARCDAAIGAARKAFAVRRRIR
jgi:hypothetical protein